MDTDTLIAKLTTDLRPVSRRAGETTLRLGVAGGALLVVVLFVITFSLRPDFAAAIHGFSFWMKFGYTLSITSIGWIAVSPVWRPGAKPTAWIRLLAPPVALLAAIVVGEWQMTSPQDVDAFWFGSSWWQCPLRITFLAGPAAVATFYALSRLAPTDERQAGTAAGLLAGGIAASIYCLCCGETSAGFVLVWYTLGMAIPTFLGRWAGPWLLRW